jgi:hypothetical protein
MNYLDRYVKRERKRRYKRLRKLFKARDAASKYIDIKVKVSLLDKNLSRDIVDGHFTSDLAKLILHNYRKILGIYPKPPKAGSYFK